MTPLEASQHELVTYAKQHLWESGSTTVPKQFLDGFYALPPEDQQLVRAFFFGATVGCPSVFSLGDNPEYGPAYQERRYCSIGIWYRLLKEGDFKDDYFGDPVDLTYFGERGKQDAGWIPEERKRNISGTLTYEGYTLPRMIIDVLNYSAECQPSLDPMAEISFVLDSLKNSLTSLRAIAALACYMRDLGIPPEEIKTRIFDSDYAVELPKSYWYPLFRFVSDILPDELQYHD